MPALQLVHAADPVTDVHEPASQLLHVLLAAGANVPTAHVLQAVLPAKAEYVPALQLAHATELVACAVEEYVPAPHWLHVPAPVPDHVPATQLAQTLDAIVAH